MTQLTYRSKKDYVYEALKHEILSGARAPGARLVIDDLAAELQVSPIPVREALQQLRADGYVVIQPYIGAKVAELRVESIYELFAVLEALGVISAVAAAERMSERELDELERMVDEMEQSLGNPERWSYQNLAFHQLICARAGTILVEALLRKAQEHWDRLRRYYFADVYTVRLPASQREHRQIVRALRLRAPQRVEEAIRTHYRNALTAYVAHMKAPVPVAERGVPRS